MTALKKLYFGETFINGMQLLLRNQESWITNGGTTTKDFKLEKGTRQRDLISAYLLIAVLEIALLYIKQNANINGIDIFNNIFLYSVRRMIQRLL